MKKMSSRKITSVIDDIENVSSGWKFRFKAMMSCQEVEHAAQAGSLRRSMNSIVFDSMEFMTRLMRAVR